MANVGVLGAGSWGTALSVLLSDNGHQVTVWSIDENEVKMLNEKREHELKLPGVKLPDDMVITGDLGSTIRGRDFLVLAVPSPFTRSTAKKMSPFVAEGQIIVDVAKGIEESTLMTLSRQIEQEIPQADVAVLSGPSHAEEVGRRLPTTCVIGARTRGRLQNICSLCSSAMCSVSTRALTSLGSSLEVPLRMSLHWPRELRTVWGTETIQKLPSLQGASRRSPVSA